MDLSEAFRSAGRAIGTHMDLNEYDLVVNLGKDQNDPDNQRIYVAQVTDDLKRGGVHYSHIEVEPSEDLPDKVLNISDLDASKYEQSAKELENDVIGGIRSLPNYEEFGLMDGKGFKEAMNELWRLKEVYPEGTDKQILAEDLFAKGEEAVTNRAIAISITQIKADMIEKINADDNISNEQKVQLTNELDIVSDHPGNRPAEPGPGFTP